MNKYFFSVLLFLQTHSLIAQDSGSQKSYLFPQDITISADRFETPLRFSASSVTIITEDEIKNSGTTNPLELIKSVSGLEFFQYGGKGQSASVMLRGHDAGHTLVLIDGVEQNMSSDPTNIADFGNINTANISRIEIIRGAQSTAYGSNAIGGVVNIITKSAGKDRSIQFNSEYGTYSTFKKGAAVSTNFNGLGISVSGLSESTKGFSSASEGFGNYEKDGSQNNNIAAKISYDEITDFHLELNSKYSKSKTDLDHYGAWKGDDSTYKYAFDESATGISGIYTGLLNCMSIKFGTTFIRSVRNYKYDYTFNNFEKSTSQYDGRRLKSNIQLDYSPVSELYVSAGIEEETQSALSTYNYETVFYFYDATLNEYVAQDYNSLSTLPYNSLKSTGVFGSLRFTVNNIFCISVGGRTDYHQIFGRVNTYKVAPVLIIEDLGLKLKSLYTTGFRAPSLFNLLDPLYGNKDLKPENSKSIEIGFEKNLDALNSSLEVTYFKSNMHDLIGSDPITFKPVNIDNALISGIEAQTSYKFNYLFRLNANYTYLLAINKGSVASDYDKSLLRRPKNKANVSLSIAAAENINICANIMFIGKRDDKFFDMRTYTSGRVVLPSYSLTDISVNYRMVNSLELYARAGNVFNKKYEEIFGFGTPGFTLNFGARLDFNL